MRRAVVRCGVLVLAVLIWPLSGCSSQTVRTTAATQPTVSAAELAPIPEDLLLDVGVDIFDPGFENIDEKQATTTPGIRRAEAYYASFQLAETLQNSGNWGAVRVIPDEKSIADVAVNGEILQSDGETMRLRVTVEDSAGKTWYTRDYSEEISRYAYDRELRNGSDPFQNLYLRIARDMVQYMRTRTETELAELRAISKMRFAQSFAPDAFDEYLQVDSRGRYHIKRLPADDDPQMARVDRIRVRDQMFVDRLQDFYRNFENKMERPYDQWREESYRETRALRELKADATARKIGGVLAVVAGILAQGSGSRTMRSAGVVGIGAGAMLFKSGLDRSAEAEIHSLALQELAESLDAETEPHRVQLADQTVTLSGTVEEQYQQWREILREIYLAETAPISAPDYTD
jgi:hypothetical protein